MAFPTKKFDVQSSDYSTIQETLSGTVASGDYVINNDVAGFYFTGGVSGDIRTIVTKSPRVKCFKKSAETWARGEALYWDDSGVQVTNVAGALVLIGYATEAAVSSQTVGFMEFDGFADFLKT